MPKSHTPYRVFDVAEFCKRECKTRAIGDAACEAQNTLFYRVFSLDSAFDERRGRGPGFRSFLYAPYAAAPWHFLYLLR
jgi:hypothetical protein